MHVIVIILIVPQIFIDYDASLALGNTLDSSMSEYFKNL